MSHLSLFRNFWEPFWKLEYDNAVFNGEQGLCEAAIEKSDPHDHRLSSLASFMVPNGDPQDRFFYPTLTLIIYYISADRQWIIRIHFTNIFKNELSINMKTLKMHVNILTCRKCTTNIKLVQKPVQLIFCTFHAVGHLFLKFFLLPCRNNFRFEALFLFC